ncbi:MAG: energy-coupled thiamine transporter ThiT, partial [Lachnospiraceae bacterium]
AGCLGRYFFAFLSGWIFFGSYAWEGWNGAAYSAVYNAIYIGAEAAITVVILCIPAVNKALARIKVTANTEKQ